MGAAQASAAGNVASAPKNRLSFLMLERRAMYYQSYAKDLGMR